MLFVLLASLSCDPISVLERQHAALTARAEYYERKAEEFDLRFPEMARFYARKARYYRCRAYEACCRLQSLRDCQQSPCALDLSP